MAHRILLTRHPTKNIAPIKATNPPNNKITNTTAFKTFRKAEIRPSGPEVSPKSIW
jgi:hypothetical protein